MKFITYLNTTAFYLAVFLVFPFGVLGDTFEADKDLATRAAKKADELTQFVEAQFQVKLDYSEQSIEELDPIIDQLHAMFIDEQPPEAQLIPLAQAFGSYIGEVYRRSHQGSWGWITQGEKVFPGFEQSKGGLFWPWAKVLDRIKTNEDPSISDYYHYLVIR